MSCPKIIDPAQGALFGVPSPLPEGFVYEPGFLGKEEEAALLRHIQALPLAPMRYKSYQARRRVVSFGSSYDFDAHRLRPCAPLADWLEPLRRRAARWLGVAPGRLVQALVAEYAPGTPLGWHRDVPDYEDIVGVSLAGPAVLRLRPYPPDAAWRRKMLQQWVEPRSIYMLRGPARWAWQHQVPPTPGLRYSITFRTPAARC